MALLDRQSDTLAANRNRHRLMIPAPPQRDYLGESVVAPSMWPRSDTTDTSPRSWLLSGRCFLRPTQPLGDASGLSSAHADYTLSPMSGLRITWPLV